MIKVVAMGSLRRILGREELELRLEKIEVKELLDMVFSMCEQKNVVKLDLTTFLITVNGVEISALKGEKTIVRSGDKVVLVPISHGG